MSSTGGRHIAGENFLDLHVQAARRQFDTADIHTAARRFREKLPPAPQARHRTFSWPSLVGAASILFVAIAAMSLFIPGDSATAFAQAQQWLGSFRTLRAETTVIAGDAVSNVVAWLDDSGDTRVESLGATTIIKPATGMIYITLPDGQTFARPIGSASVVGSATEFIDNVRTFQGQADLLAESRTIEGIAAVGYSLEIDGSTNVMWIDPADGRPLLVEAQMPGGQTMRTVLQFDVPLPENAFEIPDGIVLFE